MTSTLNQVLLIALASSLMLLKVVNGGKLENKGVVYDGRSLIINGKRELLFSGSIHYPRSPPEVHNFAAINISLVKFLEGSYICLQLYAFKSPSSLYFLSF